MARLGPAPPALTRPSPRARARFATTGSALVSLVPATTAPLARSPAALSCQPRFSAALGTGLTRTHTRARHITPRRRQGTGRLGRADPIRSGRDGLIQAQPAHRAARTRTFARPLTATIGYECP